MPETPMSFELFIHNENVDYKVFRFFMVTKQMLMLPNDETNFAVFRLFACNNATMGHK